MTKEKIKDLTLLGAVSDFEQDAVYKKNIRKKPVKDWGLLDVAGVMMEDANGEKDPTSMKRKRQRR